MHPFARNLVIGAVGLLVAAALAAVALLGQDTGVSVAAMLASGLLAAALGIFLFGQGWIWSTHAWRRGWVGRSLLIAAGGGLMILLAALALAGVAVLVLLFVVG